MGWASGSEIAQAVIEGVRDHVPNDKQREKIYRPIIKALLDHDWDTCDEVRGEDAAFDKVLKEEANFDEEDS